MGGKSSKHADSTQSAGTVREVKTTKTIQTVETKYTIPVIDPTIITAKRFKVVFFGGPRVGKTSLVERWLNNRFDTTQQTPTPTNRVAISTRTLEINTSVVNVELWDTPSVPELRDNLFDEYMKDADAIVLVADVDRLSSFPEVCTTLFENIKNYCELHYDSVLPPITVFANKRDLNTAFGSTAATVTEESIAATSQSFGIQKSFLVSAALNIKVDDAMDSLLRQAILMHPPRVWHPASEAALEAQAERRRLQKQAEEEAEQKRLAELAQAAADEEAAERALQAEQEMLDAQALGDDGIERSPSRASTTREGATVDDDIDDEDEANVIIRGGSRLPMLQVEL